MPEVRAELTTDRSPDELAKLVTDYYGIHTWSAGVSATAVDPTRPGTRLCTLLTGVEIAEQLLDSGPDFVRYRMLTEEGRPMSDYEAELRVAPGATGGSVLSWTATFHCADALTGPLTGGVQATFDQGLKDLAAS